MLPAPRIIAIDNEPNHLEALTRGLNRYGAACLPIHFTGDTTAIPSCPCVRVIFADLHLVDSTGDHRQHFSTLGGLIEDTIKPSGPYLIVLWTQYPDQAEGLHRFLRSNLQDVEKPFAVQALNKLDHLDPEGSERSADSLVEAIREMVSEQPQIGALLNWEERVLDAVGETVSSVVKLVDSADEVVDQNEQVGRLLASLAEAAVGREHAGEDLFRAVNEALLPILADCSGSMRSRQDDNARWQTALGDARAQLSPDEAAKLNRLLHIAASPGDGGNERGAVSGLPEGVGEAFSQTFELTAEDAATNQFWRRQSAENTRCWVLVQTQAACDYAQNQPGPLPFHLGLFLPSSEARRARPPAALWRSPSFEFSEQPYVLHVSARFQISLPGEEAVQLQPLFRLREQLLNDLIYQLHGYGARPGIISFRGAETEG